MKTKQTPEVITTRNRVIELLRLVPEKRFSDCTPQEQQRFTDLENANAEHRAAVKAARATAPRSVDQQQACSAVSPHTSLLRCDLPKGHSGDHAGQACLHPEHDAPITRHSWAVYPQNAATAS
jgi:hypothetical protein